MCKETYQKLSTQGYYTIAVAYRTLPQQEVYHASDEQNMILLGYLTCYDPPREDAGKVLEALRSDGIEVKILTGDNELVTRHICSQVGLNTDHMIVGTELDHINDTALAQVVEKTNVFARVSPARKNRIILAHAAFTDPAQQLPLRPIPGDNTY